MELLTPGSLSVQPGIYVTELLFNILFFKVAVSPNTLASVHENQEKDLNRELQAVITAVSRLGKSRRGEATMLLPSESPIRALLEMAATTRLRLLRQSLRR